MATTDPQPTSLSKATQNSLTRSFPSLNHSTMSFCSSTHNNNNIYNRGQTRTPRTETSHPPETPHPPQSFNCPCLSFVSFVSFVSFAPAPPFPSLLSWIQEVSINLCRKLILTLYVFGGSSTRYQWSDPPSRQGTCLGQLVLITVLGLPSYVYSSDRQGPFAANDLSAASHMGQYPIAPSHHAFNPLYEDAHNSTPRSIPATPQTPRGMESLSGAQPVTASLDQRPGSNNNNDPATATSVTIRPPAGYPGIMLEIRLEGGHLVQFLTGLSARGDLECLICFDAAAQSAAVHIIPKGGPPSQIVFLCLVPDIQSLGLCPVTLHVFADQTQHSVPLGAFHYKQNGI